MADRITIEAGDMLAQILEYPLDVWASKMGHVPTQEVMNDLRMCKQGLAIEDDPQWINYYEVAIQRFEYLIRWRMGQAHVQ